MKGTEVSVEEKEINALLIQLMRMSWIKLNFYSVSAENVKCSGSEV